MFLSDCFLDILTSNRLNKIYFARCDIDEIDFEICTKNCVLEVLRYDNCFRLCREILCQRTFNVVTGIQRTRPCIHPRRSGFKDHSPPQRNATLYLPVWIFHPYISRSAFLTLSALPLFCCTFLQIYFSICSRPLRVFFSLLSFFSLSRPRFLSYTDLFLFRVLFIFRSSSFSQRTRFSTRKVLFTITVKYQYRS